MPRTRRTSKARIPLPQLSMGLSCLARAGGLAQDRSAGKISCLPSLEEREIQKFIFCTDSVSLKLGNFAIGASRQRSSPASASGASPNGCSRIGGRFASSIFRVPNHGSTSLSRKRRRQRRLFQGALSARGTCEGGRQSMKLMGIDVGFSITRATTGIACLDGDRLYLRRATTAWENRKIGIPHGFRPSVMALDGPLLPQGADMLVRHCESVFVRAPFHNRCKPGLSHWGRGLELRRASAEACVQFGQTLACSASDSYRVSAAFGSLTFMSGSFAPSPTLSRHMTTDTYGIWSIRPGTPTSLISSSSGHCQNRRTGLTSLFAWPMA